MTPLVECQCGLRFGVPSGAEGRVARCPMCDKALRFFGSDGEKSGYTGVLEIQSGPDRVGERIYCSGPTPIPVGKGPDQALLLAADRVSRRHCVLLPKPAGEWALEDLSSTNGLWIDGRRVKSHTLSDRNMITIGDYTLLFRAIRANLKQRDDEREEDSEPGNGGFPSTRPTTGLTADRVEEDLYRI